MGPCPLPQTPSPNPINCWVGIAHHVIRETAPALQLPAEGVMNSNRTVRVVY